MKLKAKRIYLFIPFIILLSWLGLAVLGLGPYKPKTSFEAYPLVTVSIQPRVLATGIIKATNEVDVGSQISGQLERLYVDVGDQIKEGQLLAEIDDTILQNTLLQAEANYTALQAKLRASRIQLNQAKRNKNRFDSEEARVIISSQDYEELEVDYLVALAEYEQVQQELHKADLEVRSAKKNLSFTQIKAPMDGIVVDVMTKVGQTIIASQVAPVIMRVANLDNITVEAKVSEVDILKIKEGDEAYFSIFGEPNTLYKGQIELIKPSPEIQNNVVLYIVQVKVPNIDDKLKLNMTARVTILQKGVTDVLAVNRNLIPGNIPNSLIVNVITPRKKIEQRELTFGQSDNSFIEVLSGANKGEYILIDQKLDDSLKELE